MNNEYYEFYNVIVYDDDDRVLIKKQFETKSEALAYYFHMVGEQSDSEVDSEVCIYRSSIDLLMSHKGRKEDNEIPYLCLS